MQYAVEAVVGGVFVLLSTRVSDHSPLVHTWSATPSATAVAKDNQGGERCCPPVLTEPERELLVRDWKRYNRPARFLRACNLLSCVLAVMLLLTGGDVKGGWWLAVWTGGVSFVMTIKLRRGRRGLDGFDVMSRSYAGG